MTKEKKYFKIYEELIKRGYDPDDSYNGKVVFTRANLDIYVFDDDPGEDRVRIQVHTNHRSPAQMSYNSFSQIPRERLVIDYEFPTSQDFSTYMDKVEKKYMAEVE